jgi:hypothetical protein
VSFVGASFSRFEWETLETDGIEPAKHPVAERAGNYRAEIPRATPERKSSDNLGGHGASIYVLAQPNWLKDFTGRRNGSGGALDRVS